MDLPTISGSAYISTSVVPHQGRQNANEQQAHADKVNAMNKAFNEQMQFNQAAKPQQEKKVSARIVKVVIADTNESLPLESRMLYSGPEKFTDLTDQELFFEIPIGEILAKHNELRGKTLDKKQSEKFGRDIFLEPARIRDLRMVVVGIASF